MFVVLLRVFCFVKMEAFNPFIGCIWSYILFNINGVEVVFYFCDCCEIGVIIVFCEMDWIVVFAGFGFRRLDVGVVF